MTRAIPYFAYGTLQVGLPNHERFAEVLGERMSRVRTVQAHAVVVPRRPGCSNPGCGLLHRMAGLVPGVEGFRAEGDLFLVDEDGVSALDRLEGCADGARGPYVRHTIQTVAVDDDARTWDAVAYLVSDPAGWRALLERDAAQAFTEFDLRLAGASSPKPCCVRDPDHAGPHEVVDPLIV